MQRFLTCAAATFLLAISLILLPAGVRTQGAEKKAPAPAAKAATAQNGQSQGVQHPIDRILALENSGLKVLVAPKTEDLAFLRRITVDLIGRIPTEAEIIEFQGWPAAERRTMVIDKLLADGRFADRWTIFYADMLRLRSGADGGTAFHAFIHQAVEKGMPYDEMCRQLITANGKANRVPQVGFILGDGADPMALAGVTSQTFLGIRVACAQCHDHPFDKWTREDFYGLAAYFGKTRRIENQFTRTVYTMEAEQTTVLWPPEGAAGNEPRKPMPPAFPFAMLEEGVKPEYITRLTNLRNALAAKEKAREGQAPSLDDLLAEADEKVAKATDVVEIDATGVLDENKKEVSKLGLSTSGQESALRIQLAKLITSPRNRYFSRSFTNRVWAELIGKGIVEPIDDFSDGNKPSHPQTLDFLADEFVAEGFDLRKLVRLIVTSDVYQRQHLAGVALADREAAEAAFTATPTRRMISEVLYDSVIVAGHLFQAKHEEGKNLQVVWRQEQIVKQKKSTELAANNLNGKPAEEGADPQMAKEPEKVTAPAYNLEQAIELDFAAVLAQKEEDEPAVDEMRVMSKEEVEAEMMTRSMRGPGVQYIDRFVKMIVDDNPVFTTAMRMATPADPSHFLRIFGQPARDALGDRRDDSATMRQALMMLNGRLTHEAARVGEKEPVYALLVGKKADVPEAVRLVYRELLTREPTAAEVTEAELLLKEAGDPLDGMTDLRWVLYNCHEFRFIP